MNFQRSAGILLHPTSLPGKFGIGDFGSDAYRFVDFLVSAGQSIWQVLPLGPTGYGDSPYQSFSAFAGNPLLISPEKLFQSGLVKKHDLENVPNSNPSHVDFGSIIEWKYSIFNKAFDYWCEKINGSDDEKFQSFVKKNEAWLDDFALFMALKDINGGKSWNQWESNLALRNTYSLEEVKKEFSRRILFHQFLQYQFHEQWMQLKSYANKNGIRLIGDVPIFISYDSADAWSYKHLFSIDSDGNLISVAGVPPDYFSKTGQRWGNPLYRWDEMKKDDYAWWRERLSKLFELFDILRLDHFRGFEAYWEVPASAPTAEKGKWIKGPGEHFFTTIQKYLGKLAIIAEDLGYITKEVICLRDKFNFPGMKVLQFAFGPEGEKAFLPHNYSRNCVVYTGTHDNDTTVGFFKKAKKNNPEIFYSAQKYLGSNSSNICFNLIRTAYASVANMVVIPMQDILNLGSEARMNFPGRSSKNWTWRFTWDQINEYTVCKYRELSELYERNSISMQ